MRFRNGNVLIDEYVNPHVLKGEPFVFDLREAECSSVQKAFYYLHRINCQLPAALNKQIG